MKECLQVFHLTTFDAPKYALKDAYLTYLAMFGIFDAPKYALKDTYLAMFGIFGSIYECAKWVSECRLWVYNAENYSSDSSYL